MEKEVYATKEYDQRVAEARLWAVGCCSTDAFLLLLAYRPAAGSSASTVCFKRVASFSYKGWLANIRLLPFTQIVASSLLC